MSAETYGDLARKLRESLGMNQGELAVALGCTPAMVSGVETHRWRYGAKSERTLAELTGVSRESIEDAPSGGASDAA